jgi:hypothetical protein
MHCASLMSWRGTNQGHHVEAPQSSCAATRFQRAIHRSIPLAHNGSRRCMVMQFAEYSCTRRPAPDVAGPYTRRLDCNVTCGYRGGVSTEQWWRQAARL